MELLISLERLGRAILIDVSSPSLASHLRARPGRRPADLFVLFKSVTLQRGNAHVALLGQQTLAVRRQDAEIRSRLGDAAKRHRAHYAAFLQRAARPAYGQQSSVKLRRALLPSLSAADAQADEYAREKDRTPIAFLHARCDRVADLPAAPPAFSSPPAAPAAAAAAEGEFAHSAAPAAAAMGAA